MKTRTTIKKNGKIVKEFENEVIDDGVDMLSHIATEEERKQMMRASEGTTVKLVMEDGTELELKPGTVVGVGNPVKHRITEG